jgi:hypothetical protein
MVSHLLEDAYLYIVARTSVAISGVEKTGYPRFSRVITESIMNSLQATQHSTGLG